MKRAACFTTSATKQAKAVKAFKLADIGEGITEVEIVKWCLPSCP